MPAAQKVILPAGLKVGNYFSHRGSPKIYLVQTGPRACRDFDSGVICHGCKHPIRHSHRIVLEVSDGMSRDHMGMRLRAEAVCTIHDSFEG